MLTLSNALKTGKLAEFVKPEQQLGVGLAERKKLEKGN
jgi:hypothetical protein